MTALQEGLSATTRRRPFRIALLGCSASKLTHAAPAAQLYTGQLFKAAQRVAERLADRYVILSALHRVVSPERILEPYDYRLPTVQRELGLWGHCLRIELDPYLRDVRAAEVLCLAPASYVDHLPDKAAKHWVSPLRHLGIGHQKARLRLLLQEAMAYEPAPLPERPPDLPVVEVEVPTWQPMSPPPFRNGKRISRNQFEMDLHHDG